MVIIRPVSKPPVSKVILVIVDFDTSHLRFDFAIAPLSAAGLLNQRVW